MRTKLFSAPCCKPTLVEYPDLDGRHMAEMLLVLGGVVGFHDFEQTNHLLSDIQQARATQTTHFEPLSVLY